MKIIRFFTHKLNGDLGKPILAKRLIPTWYKDSEATIPGPDEEIPGLKKCVPFLDAMISGYLLVSPFDVFVSKDSSGNLKIEWNSPDPFQHFIAERQKELGEKMPRPAGHYPNHLAFDGNWGFKTPKGWSMLITHPLNRHDLPWTITSGIMDTDKYSTGGNLPFFMKEDFVGMIPAGTPFAQLIPIKRASWKSINNDQGLVYLQTLQGETVRSPGKSYKKFFWVRKDYN